MDKTTSALIDECKRQEESCKFTAASLYIWQKRSRFWRAVFIIAPIVFGSIAGSQIIGVFGEDRGKLLGLASGLLAGFFPAIYSNFDLGMHVKDIGRAAGDFTSLRDRFRLLANVDSLSSYEEFRSAFEQVIDRKEAVRSGAPTAPEWCFKIAQKKIKDGDYTFAVDEKDAPASEPSSQAS
ncbi:hypothetical protein GCM10022281_18000 [Sphingomonas rosea]|uniref:SLATT domain-containing protein n=1 Tax=Sphingomonas rosea TaxID=335605 RepID=A0ABP7U8B4_9SPHN